MHALVNNHPELDLPADTLDGQARQQAMHGDQLNDQPDVFKVSYSSAGTLLIIGTEMDACAIAERLKSHVSNKLVIAVSELS